MTILAMHPTDILPIAVVILVWVGLHRLRRKGREGRQARQARQARQGKD